MSKESGASVISMKKLICVTALFSITSFFVGQLLQQKKSEAVVVENATSTSCDTVAALKSLSTEPNSLSAKKVEESVKSEEKSFSDKKTPELMALFDQILLEGDPNIPLSQTDFFKIQNELVARLNNSEEERLKFRESFIANASSRSADTYLAVMQQMESSRSSEELTKVADTLAVNGSPEFYDHIVNAVSYGGSLTENTMRVFEEIMKGGGSEKQSLNVLATVSPYEASDNLIRYAKERANQILNSSSDATSRAQALDRMLTLTPYEDRNAITLKGLQDSNLEVNYGAISSIASGHAPYNKSIKEKLLAFATQPEHPLNGIAKQVLFSRDNLTKEEFAKMKN